MSTDDLFHLATGSLQVAAGISPIGSLVVHYQHPTARRSIPSLALSDREASEGSVTAAAGTRRWNLLLLDSHPICPPMLNTKLLADGQARIGAAVMAGIAPIHLAEDRKQPRLLLLGDTGTAVYDFKAQVFFSCGTICSRMLPFSENLMALPIRFNT